MISLLLCSGGLDSTTLAYHLVECGEDIQPIFLDYGQHCASTEWDALNKCLPKGIPAPLRFDIGDIYRMSSSRMVREADPWHEDVKDSDLYLPYRTLLFFSVSASIAQSFDSSTVYAAYINGNHAKELDCTAAFFNGLDEFAENVGSVRFVLPFKSWSKLQVLKEAIRLGVDVGSTFSCQLFGDTPCGACPNCVERLNAIRGFREEHADNA